MIDSIISFGKRNGILIILMLILLYFISAASQIIETALTIAFFECVALILSGAALYFYTKIDFITVAVAGIDREYSAYERMGNNFIIAAIFLGTHLLTAITIFGVYYLQFMDSAR